MLLGETYMHLEKIEPLTKLNSSDDSTSEKSLDEFENWGGLGKPNIPVFPKGCESKNKRKRNTTTWKKLLKSTEY